MRVAISDAREGVFMLSNANYDLTFIVLRVGYVGVCVCVCVCV